MARSDGRIEIIETLVRNGDQPAEILRSSYLAHQNHGSASTPLSTPAVAPSSASASRSNADKPFHFTVDKPNITDEDYNIVLEFQPEDKSLERLEVELTPHGDIFRTTPPALSAPSGTKEIREWRESVDDDGAPRDKGKKRATDSDMADEINPGPSNSRKRMSQTPFDISKFSPPTSFERGSGEMADFEDAESKEVPRRHKKRRVEPEAFRRGEVQPLRRSARLRKDVGNDEESKFRESRSKKGKGKAKK